MPQTLQTDYLNYLRDWSKNFSNQFSDLFLYGSLPKGNFYYSPSCPSDFDIMALLHLSLQHTPWGRVRCLQHLRTKHSEAIAKQTTILREEYQFSPDAVVNPCKHSYAIVTAQETRFSIVKNTRDTEFLSQFERTQYSLCQQKPSDVYEMVKDTVPEHLREYADLLKKVQEQRRKYVLFEGDDSDVQFNYEDQVKAPYRWLAHLVTETLNVPDGLQQWQLLITKTDWYEKILATESKTQRADDLRTYSIEFAARLQRCSNNRDLQLTVLDCVFLWELLAELCYEKLEEFETRPERCDRFLKDLCEQSVEGWKRYQREENMTYLGCGLSVQKKPEKPDLPERSEVKPLDADAKDPAFFSICDPHADDDDKLLELWHWRPNTDRNPNNPQEDLCTRLDSPQSGLRLLLTEDAGTGKSVFLRRLQGWLCDQTAREKLVGKKPPLVLRWQSDGSESMAWPTPTAQGRWRTTLRDHLTSDLRATHEALLQKHHIQAEDLVAYLFSEPERIVLLFDAYDQLTDPRVQLRRDLLKAFHPDRSVGSTASSDDDIWGKMHVLVTSRKIAVREEFQKNGRFQPNRWVIARLDGWTDRQQVEFLRPVLMKFQLTLNLDAEQIENACKDNQAAKKLLDNEKIFKPLTTDARTLLRVPQLLQLVRKLAEANDKTEFPTFVNRADLYQKVISNLLNPTLTKTVYEVDGNAVEARNQDAATINAAEYLSCIALEMMLAYPGRFVIVNKEFVELLAKCAQRTARANLAHWDRFLNRLPALTVATSHLISEQFIDAETLFAWKHREMMEYFCARFLKSNQQQDWPVVSTTLGVEAYECNESRLKKAAANPQWDSTWKFLIELIELDAPQDVDPEEPTFAPVSIAASLSTLFEPNKKYPRPTERMWDALRWAKHHNWHEFDHWKQKLNRQFQDILKGSDKQTAALAATLLPPEALTKYNVTPANAVEEGETANWQLCPPRNSQDSQLQDWLKQREANDQPGTFWFRQGSPDTIGYPNERPQHWWPVRRFWMQATTVTVAQYRLFDPGRLVAEIKNLDQKAKQEDCPMIRVNWYDAALFACWVGEKCRLPSESEWEFACRAGFDGDQDLFSLASGGSGSLDGSQANFNGNWPRNTAKTEQNSFYVDQTLPVRWTEKVRQEWKHHDDDEKPPAFRHNRWGLWQMHGNVWEWCVDPNRVDIVEVKDFIKFRDEDDKYKLRVAKHSQLVDNNTTPTILVPSEAATGLMYTVGPSRVLRGGSWRGFGGLLRCAFRSGGTPDDRFHDIGFRLCWGE
jgi:formylglycine-generating enzyme required for sulfatase activity